MFIAIVRISIKAIKFEDITVTFHPSNPDSMKGDYESEQKAKDKKNKPKERYNPFKDGRTPTSASETTGP